MTTKEKTKTAAKPKGVSKECKLKNEEMEVHLSFDLVSMKWTCWTTLRKHMTKMKKAKWPVIKTEYYTDGTVYSMSFEAPENAVSFRTLVDDSIPKKPRAPRAPLTDEQKEKMRLGRLAKKAEQQDS